MCHRKGSSSRTWSATAFRASRAFPQTATRSCGSTAVIENGFVFVPEEAPWLADYLAELTTFPAGRHDDQVELDRPDPGLDEGRARG